MRLAHFIHRYPPALGGSEAYFARLSRFLAARGHEVTVFTSNALDLTAFWSPAGRCLPAGVSEVDGVVVRRYPLWRLRGRRYLLKPLSLLPHRQWQCLTLPCNPICWRMWRDAGRPGHAFDAVHATAFPYGWPLACARLLARRSGVPFLLTPFLHTGDPDDRHDRTRRAYTSPALMSLARSADAVFAQTPGERDALAANGVPAEKIILHGLGVDPDGCTGGDRAAARGRWAVPDGVPVVGHLANLSREKGTVDLLQAAAGLWDRGLSFRVVIAGAEMPNFQKYWQTYRYRDLVCRLGRVSEQEKRDFFAAIDAFALPSRSDSFGLVLLEAWANGVPNLGYRAGGVADVIRHGEDGLLVRCGDVAALGESLGRLLTGPALRRRLGNSGRARVLTDFRWQDKLELVEEAYVRALRDPSGALRCRVRWGT